MKGKQRLSASVDKAVLAAAQTAVSSGLVANISEWVNQAMHRQAELDQRMRALDEFLLAYETEHGTISDTEIEQATRRARARAVVKRGAVRAAPAQPARPSRSAGRRQSGAR